jgi:GNAT superfamily N-acetyltransferase
VTIRIDRAAPAGIPELAGVLARAFAADPMVVWPLVSDEDLEARIRRSFELVDSMYAADGWILQAEGGLGVMSLIPPDGAKRANEIDVVVAGAMGALTPDAGERYGRFWEWIEAGHPPERHWLLDQLAVEPRAQGRGIGTAMLQFAMQHAAADGLPLFLETGVARNVAFYERFGFSVIRDADAPSGGPHVWFMRRDAGTVRTR